jgi:hypothetical protein
MKKGHRQMPCEAAVATTERRIPMSQIEWTAPPGHGNSTTNWSAIADELRSKPSVWAKVKADTTNAALAARIKRGSGPWGPTGSFEATTRGTGVNINGARVMDVYARYVGEAAPR